MRLFRFLRKATPAPIPAPERVVQGAARAVGGAVVFSFPLLMTMEMWQLGFTAHPLRIALFLILSVPALVALSHYSGFEKTFGWREDVVDAFSALAVGVATATVMLSLMGLIAPGQGPTEIAGMIAMQTPPASLGAMVARKMFGGPRGADEDKPANYRGELFIMAVGALYLAFNVAPTEEMMLIAYQLTPAHALLLMGLSLLALHVFVYALGFRGEHAPERETGLGLFLHFTLAGYFLALATSLYVLWTFGRLDGEGVQSIAATVVVLGFPASLGAATSRLVI